MYGLGGRVTRAGRGVLVADILLVEDDEGIRRFIRKVLEREGYNIVEAGNGKDALACIEAQPFDVVISDVFMPEMDGLEAIKAIREILPTAKLVSMSGGFQGIGLLAVAEALGADLVLPKPFTAAELIEAISGLMTSP